MFFKKTNCPTCNHNYDELLDYCPFCKARNETNVDYKKKYPMTFIEWYKELILLLFGLVGFTLVNIIFSLIFAKQYEADKVYGLMLVNSASYAVFFVVVIIVLFPYARDLFNRLKIWDASLWGLLGAVVLVAGSILLNVIVQLIRPGTGEGGNQSAVIQFVQNYSIISIFVIGIIGPLCEEAAYRIGLFSLCHRVHPVLAYFVTAIVFGLIHFDFTSSDLITELLYLPNYIWGGICFSVLYQKKGIVASSTAHILNNMYSIVLIIMQSNIPQA